MKKVIKIIFGFSFLTMNMVASELVFGEEVTDQSNDSSISIGLVESPLHLVNVQAPSFGTYELSGGNQIIQATDDLVIQVEDTRTTNLNSWGIQYEVSIFDSSKGTNSLGESSQISIGSGKLTMNNQSVDTTAYDSRSVKLAPNKSAILLQVESSLTNSFSYRVEKENITIMIPELTNPGTYEAIQTVTLIDLPIVK